MTGRVCIVTGGSSGIGRETARGLAALGATVVLAVRNPAKGEAVKADIVATTGNPRVEVMALDLAQQGSVRAFVDAFRARHDRLHVLVNNAGIFTTTRTLTPEGYESTFAINHLGHFLLTNLLLELLKASAPSRIVNVSSEAQRWGTIDLENLNGETPFRGMKAYSQSKLANVLFTRELAKKLAGTGVTVNSLHPGVVRTNFGRGIQGPVAVGMLLARPFMISPRKGARTSIYLASSPEVEGVTGKYFIRRHVADPSPNAGDPILAQRLWDVSERLTNLARVKG